MACCQRKRALSACSARTRTAGGAECGNNTTLKKQPALPSPSFHPCPACPTARAQLSSPARPHPQAGGSAALEALLAREAEEARPEFLRQREKYHYYYEWMRGRLAQHCPGLPEPVVKKALGVDADELNMILDYPAAIRKKVGFMAPSLPHTRAWTPFHASDCFLTFEGCPWP